MIEQTVNLAEHPGWIERPRSRRIAEFSIADSMLLGLFMRPDLTWRVEHDPLPEDARLVGVQYRAITGTWAVYIESETFDEVGEAKLPPPLKAPTLSVQMDARPEGEGE